MPKNWYVVDVAIRKELRFVKLMARIIWNTNVDTAVLLPRSSASEPPTSVHSVISFQYFFWTSQHLVFPNVQLGQEVYSLQGHALSRSAILQRVRNFLWVVEYALMRKRFKTKTITRCLRVGQLKTRDTPLWLSGVLL